MKGIRSQHAAQEQESAEWKFTPNVPRGKGLKLCTLPLPTREIQVQAGLITHCAWQRVSLAARTSTEHRTGIPKETRMSQAERKGCTCRAGHAGRLGDPA